MREADIGRSPGGVGERTGRPPARRAPRVHVRRARSSATQPRGFATRARGNSSAERCRYAEGLRAPSVPDVRRHSRPATGEGALDLLLRHARPTDALPDHARRKSPAPLRTRRLRRADPRRRAPARGARVTRPSPPEATLDAPVICTAVSRRRGSRRFRRVRETRSARVRRSRAVRSDSCSRSASSGPVRRACCARR